MCLSQIVNITVSSMPKATRQQRVPVDVVFVVRDARGFLQGADVSAHLRILNMVEFSYYLGLPVLQIAERTLHTSHTSHTSHTNIQTTH